MLAERRFFAMQYFSNQMHSMADNVSSQGILHRFSIFDDFGQSIKFKKKTPEICSTLKYKY